MDFIIDAAIQYLSERSFSEKQLREQLLSDFKDLSDLDSLMNLAIARLKKLELINDFRVAESLTQRFCHKGDSFIKQTLEQKGITEKIINKALASIDDESSRALQEARKKSEDFHGLHHENTKITLQRFLTGRGFSFSAIQFVLRKLTQEENYGKENFISQNWKKTSLFELV